MKSHHPKNLASFLALFLVLLPVFYFLFKTLPDSGISFWEFIGRFSQWKPAAVKGWNFVIFFVFYLALLLFFIFASARNIDE